MLAALSCPANYVFSKDGVLENSDGDFREFQRITDGTHDAPVLEWTLSSD